MAISKKNAFSRRLPDLVTEELVAVLSQKKSFEFKALFDLVHANLRARNAASGGEEMLRLRAYEKLQNLVSRGMVKKTLKEYRGQPNIMMALPQPMPPFVPQTPVASTVTIRSIYAEDYDPSVPLQPVAKVAAPVKPEVSVKILPKVAPKTNGKPKKVTAKKPAQKVAAKAKKSVARKPAKKVVAKKPAKKVRRRAVAA